MINYSPIKDEVFHVHTSRCKHAGKAKDIEYVKTALSLGAKRIVFTDHAPFPGDPFKSRMDYAEFPGYIESIARLKEEFDGKIEVLCGLEIEYLPSFKDYYHELAENPGIDLLINGQHFYEYAPNKYSADLIDKTKEPIGQSLAMVEAINSGLFSVIAHPDRSFRKVFKWGETEDELSKAIINAAYKDGKWNGTYFEWNYSSSQTYNFLHREFWNLIPDSKIVVYGLDAHITEEVVSGWDFRKQAPKTAIFNANYI